MFRLVVSLCVLAAAANSQNVDPKLAKILKEQRFNVGDGRAGAAFATEDGVIFKEETDIDGNRIGQYSYVGDDGNTYVVRYSAGKEGFRILDGAHIPSGGQGAAPFVADPDEELPLEPAVPADLPPPSRPVPRPAPRRPPPPPPQPIQQQQPVFLDYEDIAPVAHVEQPKRNPFINPHDPTHRDFRFNKNAVRFDPASPLAQQQSLVPPCADCENVNPFINPFDATHQAGAGILAGHLAGHLAGVPRAQPRPRPAPRPRPQTVVPVPQVQADRPIRKLPLPARPLPQPTAAPRNFFPPGQLNLNRFETGFNFDFES